MRIRPWVVTGLGGVFAVTALWVLVVANDPYTTSDIIRALFWLALFLGLWGSVATFFIWIRMNIGQAIWGGLILAFALFLFPIFWRAGLRDRRLFGGLILVTLLLVARTWWQLRNGKRA